MSNTHNAGFIQQVIAAANDRGARGEERTITRLVTEAVANGWSAPKPAEVLAQLATITKKDGNEVNEVSPVQFVYAFYLARTYGYTAKDARRISRRLGRELDGMMVDDTTASVLAITKAEQAWAAGKQDTAVSDAISAIKSRVGTLKKRVTTLALTDEDEREIASILDDLRSLTTHTSSVEALTA